MITKVMEDDQSEVEGPNFIYKMVARILWSLFLIVIIGTVYYQLTQDDVLPIQEIKVSGEFNQLLSQDIQPIISKGVQGNFFTVNVTDLYQQMLSLPWVEKVWIHRIWPNTIKVNFQEQVPVAILKGKGLLNQSGNVFSHDSAAFEKILPMFVVAKNYVHESVLEYQKNVKILTDNGLEVQIFYYDERKAQAIKLSNGIKLILGRVDVTERLMKFVQAYKAQLKHEKRKIDKVDLRYTNGFAVSWKQSLAILADYRKYVA